MENDVTGACTQVVEFFKSVDSEKVFDAAMDATLYEMCRDFGHYFQRVGGWNESAIQTAFETAVQNEILSILKYRPRSEEKSIVDDVVFLEELERFTKRIQFTPEQIIEHFDHFRHYKLQRPFPMELYLNNKTGDYYRVLNVINDEVIYIGPTGLWSRPMHEWFGKNRNGEVRFVLVIENSNEKKILWPKKA